MVDVTNVGGLLERKQRFKIQDCHDFAYSKGGKCLSKVYKNANTKMEWECKRGHRRVSTFSVVRSCCWCSQCNMCPKCHLWRTMGELCQYCIPKNKNKLYQKTKEFAVVRYLREHIPDREFIHNKSVGSHRTINDRENTNGHLFPDIRFDCGHYHLIVEVDEHKHRGADYKCDERRMLDIIAKLGLPCVFIRYNPDSRASNKDLLVKKINSYFDLGINYENNLLPWDEYGFKVEYMFY